MDPPFFNEGDEGTGRAKGLIGFANTFFVIPANAWNPERKPTKNGPPFFNEGDEGTGQIERSFGRSLFSFGDTLINLGKVVFIDLPDDWYGIHVKFFIPTYQCHIFNHCLGY